jgi:RNA polymerase sigma-70 factor (family 1)
MRLLSADDEKNLFQRLAAGDESAFRSIFESYKDKIYFIALKMVKLPTVAEEVVQDILMNVWIHQVKFKNIADPEAYIVSMTYNGVFCHMKKMARDKALFNELICLVQNESLTVEDIMLSKESIHIISMAVESLTAQQKRVFYLSREQGMTYEQIARALNISIHTVRNHLAQALINIRNYLGETALSLLILLHCYPN